jgi:hypothetical protein
MTEHAGTIQILLIFSFLFMVYTVHNNKKNDEEKARILATAIKTTKADTLVIIMKPLPDTLKVKIPCR